MSVKRILSILIIFSFLTMGIVTAKEDQEISDTNKCIKYQESHCKWRVMETSNGYDISYYNYQIISKDKLKSNCKKL